MGRTVAELEETLDRDEFCEWIAFNSIEPIGDIRQDMNLAHVAATMANCHRGRNSDPFRLDDFQLKWGQSESAEELTEDKIAAKIMAVFSVM